MLILLRSDFRLPNKQAFLGLMQHAHFKTDNLFEVPVFEAPQPNAIILRLRKMEAEKDSVIVMGTSKNETLEQSLRVLDEVRKGMPFLSIFPAILLARKSEWSVYDQVIQARRRIECFEMAESSALVLEQRESYSESTHRLVLAYLLPPKLLAKEGSPRDGGETTQQFMIGDRHSGTLPRLTDEMLREAGIEGSIEPESEDRITEMPPPPDFPFDPTKNR